MNNQNMNKTFRPKKPSKPQKPLKTAVHRQVTTPQTQTGIRINKYIAEQYRITRREADRFIEDGLVHISAQGKKRHAKLGDKIDPTIDTVTISQKKLKEHTSKYVYFAYNKPVGIVTHSPSGDELDIKNLLLKQSSVAPHLAKELFPIGRLDKKSDGLIILTNDGKLSDLLLNPSYEHEKEYTVTTIQDLPSYFKKSMEKGVHIGEKGHDQYITKPCQIELRGPKTFSIKLTEGKKHQIRRMCEAMKVDVKSLRRTRIMNISLDSLRPNELRKIEGQELEIFMHKLH